MKEQLQMLWELQRLEQRKRNVLQRKDNVKSDEVRMLWQQIQQAARLATADRQKLQTVQQQCAEQEQDLNALATQLQGLEKRLYSGDLTHAKEMEQLKAKCEDFRRDISLRETTLLENLELSETLAARIASHEQHTEEAKRVHHKKQQDMANYVRQAEQEIADAETEYQELADRIEPQVLMVYQRLKNKYPAPVAKLDNGICSGCRMSIPTRQAAMGGGSIVYCDNCGRILCQ